MGIIDAHKICDEHALIYLPTENRVLSVDHDFYRKLPPLFHVSMSSTVHLKGGNGVVGHQPTAVVLILTGRCNLQCLYCYEGMYSKKSKEVMPREIAETAINYYLAPPASDYGGRPAQSNMEYLAFHHRRPVSGVLCLGSTAI